ncbi:YtfJ family protein [Halobacteriovorax sp. XZX-3]|uniref:YtfJ family protein n=1 Tax=unclassified Halobacteriovorax TaxID=2639665 RepID=UPI000CD275B8|nr:YtfJ family protein [Halobacteriovorax sp. DA5]POB15342.1 transcriptional regulator [Halobacteriovorax sp. DA5]
MKKFFMMALICASTLAMKPATVEISGENGGRLNGKAWSSTELKDKVHVLFYVDPDEKDLNNHASEALAREKFDRTKYASVAVINMDATWLPNSILEGALEDKQKKYPDTIYVKDLEKVIVKKWKGIVKDDDSNILVFDKKGSLVYKINGKASEAQVKEMITIIKKNM